MRYIEATLEDIALANRLAHEVLGRTLDELPPQTRRLLQLVVTMVSEQCAQLEMKRGDYRFSRRALREHTRWGDTQLKIHLARLVDLEYLLVHRGGRGQSFEYELLYSGQCGELPHLSGLIDVEALRCKYDAQRSGLEADRSGVGRPVVGGQSEAGRSTQSSGNAERIRTKLSLPAKEIKTHGTRGNGAAPSYIEADPSLAASLS